MTPPPWPAVTTEELPWRTRYPQALTARQREALPATYHAAVLPTIADQPLDLPPATVAREATAVAAIARFDHEAGTTLLPYSPLLLRSESSASSRIERLTSSARKVLEEETYGNAGGNATAVVANTRAMRAATHQEAPLTLRSLLGIHRTLLVDHEPGVAGRLRDEPVWIGGANHAPVGAHYVAPSHERIPAALDDLLAFIVRTDLTPLSRAAIAHAQLETIHPFADGNGRTGRALTHVLLRHAGLALQAPLPLSAVLLADTPSYYQALDDYRDGSPGSIVNLFIDAAIRAAEIGTLAGARLAAIHAIWQDRLTARAGTPDRDLTTLLATNPVLDVSTTASALGVSEQAARRAFARLEEAGVVIGYQVARGRRAWRAPDVLDLMDEVTDGMRRTV